MKIDLPVIKTLYSYAEKFYSKEISLKEAQSELEKLGINKNSAVDYLYNYGNLLEGKVFTRTMNVISTRYYLDNIYSKLGIDALKKALQSVSLHIDYYEGITEGNVVKRKELLNEYLERYDSIIDAYFSEEISKDKKLTEGTTKSVLVNIYERNPIARKKCIERFGEKCVVCDFDFEQKYGELGKGFIHVHHVIDLAEIGKEYEVDYTKDLVPVCPNCHAMLHKRKPAYRVEELIEIIKKWLQQNQIT